MSWEVMSTKVYPCKCGKGTYKIVSEMDDWNRHRENKILLCPICAENNRLEENRQQIIRENNAKRLSELIEEITTLFETKYMESFMLLFSNINTKKEAWAFLKEIGLEWRSMASFYNFYTGRSIKEYIRGKVTVNNMPIIIRLLNITDVHFIQIVDEAHQLNKSVK